MVSSSFILLYRISVRQNIIVLFWKYLVDIRSEAWLNLFWEYINGNLFVEYILFNEFNFILNTLL
jgi:hypothetical protein